MSEITRGTLHEAGNGFPDIGDRVHHSPTGAVYKVLSVGRLQIQQFKASCRSAELAYDCDASDLSEEEWDAVSDCRLTIDERESERDRRE